MLRWLLILLAFLGSAPAAAMPAAASACHDAGPTVHAMPGEHHRRPDPTPPHVCLGCVPVGDWLTPRIVAPRAAPRATPIARIASLDLIRGAAPPRRPPRIG